MKTLPKKVLLAIIFLVLLISASTIYFNPSSERDEYEKEVKRLFQKVKVDIDNLRNLTTPNPVHIKVVDIDYFKREASNQIDELEAARETLYKALLIVPQTFSMREYKREKAGLVVAAAAAYTLYIVREYFNPYSDEAARILAHEYTHILQYNRVKQPNLLTLDSQLAWMAFIEGEADLVAELYISNKTGRLSLTLPKEERPKGGVDGWFVDRLTLFPYIYGLRFAYSLYISGGWQALNQAHLNPPTSTLEILHPNLYLNGSKFTIPLNPTPQTTGWRIYYPDVLGAYFFNLFLTRLLDSPSAFRASARWMGDNSTLYLKEGEYLLYWQINLSTKEQAEALKETLLQSMLKESSIKDGRIVEIESRYLTVLSKDTKLLVLSASNPLLAEAAVEDLIQKGFD